MCTILMLILIIGSDHPTMQDINNHVLQEVATKWKELGEKLSLKLHILQNIRAEHREVSISAHVQ